jgi:hypothetical protein
VCAADAALRFLRTALSFSSISPRQIAKCLVDVPHGVGVSFQASGDASKRLKELPNEPKYYTEVYDLKQKNPDKPECYRERE